VSCSHGAASDIAAGAAHGLSWEPPVDRLRDLPIHRLLIPGTLSHEPVPALPVGIQSVANLLAEAIGRLHDAETLDHLLIRT
jgi:phosphoribosylpyrophosphate synthetase